VVNYTVITSLGTSTSSNDGTLQGIQGNLTGNYALGGNIDASATSSWNSGAGFAPIGTSGSSSFTGTFEGLGNTISSITIHPATTVGGLFGFVGSGGTVRDVGLSNASVAVSYGNLAGGLVGYLDTGGTVTNAWTSGSVTGNATLGGLVGENKGAISDSYSTSSVRIGISGLTTLVGGLVGNNWGTISDSYATGSVDSSISSGAANSYAGGLIGNGYSGTVSNSYATGSVTNGTGGGAAGGLVGNEQGTFFTDSYATGAVTAGSGSTAGGLSGSTVGTVFHNSFWDTQTTGQSLAAGGASTSGATGMTTAEMQTEANFTSATAANGNVNPGWDFTNTWGMVSGSYPYLRAFNPSAPTVVSGLAYKGSGDALLVSSQAGAGYVNLLVDGKSMGTVTAGANGYYYFLVPGGAVSGSGSQILAYTMTDAASGAANGASLAQNATSSVFNLDVLGNYMGYQSPASTYSGAASILASAQANLTAALGSDTAVSTMVSALNRTALVSTASTFDVDAIPSGNYAADAAAGNLVVTAPIAVASGTSLNLVSANSVAIDAPITIAGSGGLVLGAPVVSGLPALSFNSGGLVQYTGTEGSGQSLNLNNVGYTLLFTISEVQGLQNTLTGNYALAGNIDASATSAWNSGAGFTPIGTSGSNSFTGTFEGLGNTISSITIHPATTVGGLFGFVGSGGTVRDVGLSNASVAVSYGNLAGGLVGYLDTGGTVTNAWTSGSVTGNATLGGLVGENKGAISDSYSTSSVRIGISGLTTLVGGLVGNNWGTISDSYATGSVDSSISSGAANSYAGGLIGNGYSGTVSNSYATGSVTNGTGGGAAGGLVGNEQGTFFTDSYATGAVTAGSGSTAGGLSGSTVGTVFHNSFWDTQTTGQSLAAGGASTSGATGMTTAEMQTEANFTSATTANGNVNPGWDFMTTWTMYAGYTYPLLRTFMTPLTVEAKGGTMTYNGTAGNGVTDSLTPNGNLLGTLNYGVSQNVGSYTTALSGLYSNQQGYVISYVNSSLTVTPAPLAVTGETASNKVYDGTTTAALSGGTLSGTIYGSDSVSLSQAGSFASKNVGNGIVVTVADSLSGSAAGNYMLTQPTGLSANITPAPLTVTGETATNKVYDGTTTAALSGGTLSGTIYGSDSVSLSQAGSFASKNVGNGIVVTVADSLSGAASGNYMLTQPTGLSANITPLAITVTAIGADKVYDGTANDPVTLLSTGIISGDKVIFADSTATFANKNAGSYKMIQVTGISASGADAGNYTFNNSAVTMATIHPATLFYDATPMTVNMGQPLPNVPSGRIYGFAPGDTLANSATGTASWKADYGPSTPPGRFDIYGSGLSPANSNYVFAQAPSNSYALTVAGNLPASPETIVMEAPPPLTGTSATETSHELPPIGSGLDSLFVSSSVAMHVVNAGVNIGDPLNSN
jgi:hypothetical protein